MSWRCPTCGSTDHPPAFAALREKWSGMSVAEREIGRVLLATRHLHGLPDKSAGWVNAYWDAARVLFGDLLSEVEAVGGDPCDILEVFDE